ncbi:MAG: squalene/phytoene synthase family protein, partial [Solirubrobacterales bacterium]|nr:squalene/phytoene synthase family protein [Solirubrobacterales bacterium]
MSDTATPVLAEARDTTRRVARTFSLACRLLPRPLRDDVYLLYLVFRTLDDLVDDGHPNAAARVAGVRAWCEGSPACTREALILEELSARHPISRPAMRDFCAGMEQDLVGERILGEEDLDLYCYRVAGTVGVVMAGILGTSDRERAEPAAAALGMAMQRTNILRDIDEDVANGRVYLAKETVERFGGSLSPGAREALVRDQIARADALYEQGTAGIELLSHGRRAVAAAAAMYR